ncbi:CbiX/SirB N-terminal domain-containing protein [Herbivorax sp. ANBcel31]|uniref:sirohydrochlorin chelatase n=1 Tax=Herbivorax sp. ANBcel31 TaxID=3069754 RepID=UPI0027AED647|nr:CbiX/SirB N-terminal domain-containing protein [Herbivorax sp. ANBcel31]MDQ2086964.1 CbiX/SirB N-terminal domain-containing protein [Herbivorax sp. ANBcel31]
MRGILILAHGSKRQETNRILDSLVEKVKKKTGEKLVYPTYLQFSNPDFEEGIQYLVNNGAKEIRVIPLFLFDGVHVTKDIPEELERIKDNFKDIDIKMAGHIGDDDRIADIVVDKVESLN